MRFLKCFFFLIAVISILTGCTPDSVLGVSLSEKNSKISDLITKEYLDEELNSIADFEGTVSDLNRIYPVECFRMFMDGYRSAYCGTKTICILTFDDSGVKTFGRVYDFSKNKSDFQSIYKGQNIEKVKQIDPNGDYDFLYVSSKYAPCVSYHFTKDGYMIMIHYDNSLNVTKIEFELI